MAHMRPERKHIQDYFYTKRYTKKRMIYLLYDLYYIIYIYFTIYYNLFYFIYAWLGLFKVINELSASQKYNVM